jgi:mannitol/fructose-specific phosphotransferase system IIA component (Ntr-type)
MKQPAIPGPKTLEPSSIRLPDFLLPRSISLDLRASDKAETLEELVSLLPIGEPHRRIALNILSEREAIGRSSKGIPFQSVDRKRAQLFFLVVSPPIEVANQYHAVLAAIVNFGKDAHSRRRLLEAESPAEVRSILGGTA